MIPFKHAVRRLTAILAYLAIFVILPGFAAADDQLTLIYTGDMKGHVKPIFS